jgi:hypothetical protein
MSMRSRPIVVVLLGMLALMPVLAGCAYDPAARAARLQPFIGQPVAVLVASLGVPSRTYEVDGIQFLAYTERRVDYLPGVPGYAPGFGWPYGPYGGYVYGGLPPQVVEYICETTFQVVQGRVQSFTLRGNACG